MTITRPQPSEFHAFYAGYIAKVHVGGPMAALKDQIMSFVKLRDLPEHDADDRYAEGKWSVKEVLGHMCDTERLFSYRLLHIARGDGAALPGMDEKAWSAAAPHAARRMSDVADEMIAIRHATITLVDSLDADTLARSGVANNHPITVRAICWILPGHAQHHLDVLHERYGVVVE